MAKVATSLLTNDKGELLVLKRSNKVRTYKGMWGGVAGYVEPDEEPYETALKEIKEEVGLEQKDIVLIKKLEPVSITDSYEGRRYEWEIFTFLFRVSAKSKIKIDWEHSEYKWIPPSTLKKLETVPQFKEIVSEML